MSAQQNPSASSASAAALVASSTGLAAGVAPPDTYIPTYMPVPLSPANIGNSIRTGSPKRECHGRVLPATGGVDAAVQPRPVLMRELSPGKRTFGQRVRRLFRRKNVKYDYDGPLARKVQ